MDHHQEYINHIDETGFAALVGQVQERILHNAAATHGGINRLLSAEPEALDDAFELAVEQVVGSMEQ